MLKLEDKKGAMKLIAFFLFVLLVPLLFISGFANEENVAFAVNEPLNNNAENSTLNSSAALGFAEDYKKPEFYPTYSYYKDKKPPEDRIAIWGLGMYPPRHDVSIKQLSAGQQSDFEVVSYLHASWFVQSYQGLALKADYDERYFEVNIKPSEVLLGPAYPVFDDNWTQKIAVKVNAKNVPKGIYEIKIKPQVPSFEQEQEWRTAHENYVSAPPFMPEDFIKITVNVA